MSYVQFFFKRRLAITKSYIRQIVQEKSTPLTLLEVGCADGIIIRSIEKEFPTAFSALVGIDIAAEMVEEARRQNVFSNVEFFTRDAYQEVSPVDLIIETGVINYANFEEEMAFAHVHLKTGGHYLFSIAGTGSIRNRLKQEGSFADFRSYREYDRLVRMHFTVRGVQGCGLFIPYIWRVPVLARIIQGVLDPMVGWLLPSLCHEKVYLVEKK